MNDATNLLSDLKLRFNIEHPNLEDCYVFGYQCAIADLEESENPFTEGSAEYQQWMDGWWAGFYGEEPLFDINNGLSDEDIAQEPAANDQSYHHFYLSDSLIATFLKITGALAATAVVGYQVLDLVA